MSKPSTTPRIPLSDHLADQTYSAILRIGYELGIQPDDINDCRYLCWLIKCSKTSVITHKELSQGQVSHYQEPQTDWPAMRPNRWRIYTMATFEPYYQSDIQRLYSCPNGHGASVVKRADGPELAVISVKTAREKLLD